MWYLKDQFWDYTPTKHYQWRELGDEELAMTYPYSKVRWRRAAKFR